MGYHFDDSLSVPLLTGDIKRERLNARGMQDRSRDDDERKKALGRSKSNRNSEKIERCSTINDRSLNVLEI
jgi:hypothetical protein